MYQKRKMRKEKNVKKNEQESNSAMNINWDVGSYEKPL